jgi:hypothetical protein
MLSWIVDSFVEKTAVRSSETGTGTGWFPFFEVSDGLDVG